MFNPFVIFAYRLLDFYSFLIIAAVVLSLLISFNIVNRHQPLVYKLDYALRRLTEPVFQPIRTRLPDIGIDISPVIVLLFIQFIQLCLMQYVYQS